MPADSASSLTLSSSHTFTPYSEFALPSMTFPQQSKGYDGYKIMRFMMVISVFRIQKVILLTLGVLGLFASL